MISKPQKIDGKETENRPKNHMSLSKIGGEPVRTTCEYRWKVLTVLNNPPPVCLCVDVNKSQRERNKKKSHYFTIHHAKHIYFICYIGYVF